MSNTQQGFNECQLTITMKDSFNFKYFTSSLFSSNILNLWFYSFFNKIICLYPWFLIWWPPRGVLRSLTETLFWILSNGRLLLKWPKMRRVNKWTAKHEETPREGLRVNVQKPPGSIVYFKIKRCISAINSGNASPEQSGWRMQSSPEWEKEGFVSADFLSPWMANLSVIYISEGPWLTFLDFWESISVISHLWEGHALFVFQVTAFLSFLVVDTDSFRLFCVYYSSSQLSKLVLKSLRERMDDVNAPQEIEELKIILQWRDAFRSLVTIVATPKCQDLVGHEL